MVREEKSALVPFSPSPMLQKGGFAYLGVWWLCGMEGAARGNLEEDFFFGFYFCSGSCFCVWKH